MEPQATDSLPEVDAERAPRWLRFEPYLFGACALAVLFFLFAWPGDWPPGFFIDEVSVGYNARWIGKTLHDQYGTLLPLYFRALGDYKSPLFVYGAVIPELVFGPSKFSERLISTLYLLGASGMLYLVVRELTGRRRLAAWLALLSLLAPPLFFYARGAFSEASCVPFWLLVVIYALLRFEREPTRRSAIALGAAIGVFTYAYTTSRLLAPLLLGAALVIFFRAGARYRPQLPALAISGALIGLPTAIFMVLHPHELDWRYRNMVSIFRDNPTLPVAGERVVQTYFQHLLSLDFLFRTGQHHAWHNVGEGFLPLWIYAPLVLGAYSLWMRRSTPFAKFMFFLWAISPIPVALTWENLPHTSRYLHFAIIAFVLAALGIHDFLKSARPQPALMRVFLLLALFEGGLMLRTAFVDYRESFGGGGGYDGGVADALEAVFRHRSPDTPVYLPDDFFDFDGLRIAYFADLPPVSLGDHQLDALRVYHSKPPTGKTSNPLPRLEDAPSGTLVVENKSATPPKPGDLVAVVRPPGSHEPLWSIYRLQ